MIPRGVVRAAAAVCIAVTASGCAFDGLNALPLPGADHRQGLLETLSWVSRIAIDESERTVIADALEEAARQADQVRRSAGEEAPLFSVSAPTNRMRAKGEARRSPLAASGDLFKNAPAMKGNYFKVAGILE